MWSLSGSLMVQAQGINTIALSGYWEGAFIVANTQQPIKIQFYQEEGNWKCLQIMEEWHPQFGEFLQAVTFDSTNRLKFSSGYGVANVVLDPQNLELIGSIENSDPPMSIHLKKIPSPPPPDYEVSELIIPNKEIELYGHLHTPKFQKAKTAIILAGGRGCYAGNTKFDLYAKILRSYGVAVLAFQKRGNGKSGGDCGTATIDELASDLQACREYLKANMPEIENFGILGSSAGGWVMLRAHEMNPFDFLIGVVGPSTSVFDQQMQSMEYGISYFGLKPDVKEPLLEYTRMMFKARPNKRKWERFQELLLIAEEQDWKKLLEDTDIPQDQKDIRNLWVRRHNYDPVPMLRDINVPYLAIYGEKDWVVPYKENIAQLKAGFDQQHIQKLTTVIAPNAQHGTEVDAKNIVLEDANSYWRFFRVSPAVTIALIDFLKAYNFIPN